MHWKLIKNIISNILWKTSQRAIACDIWNSLKCSYTTAVGSTCYKESARKKSQMKYYIPTLSLVHIKKKNNFFIIYLLDILFGVRVGVRGCKLTEELIFFFFLKYVKQIWNCWYTLNLLLMKQENYLKSLTNLSLEYLSLISS